MSPYLIGFLCGVAVGGFLGVLLVCLMVIAGGSMMAEGERQ
jgi:hypothetical protein